MKISKLIPVPNLIKTSIASGNLDVFESRQSGDSAGKALSIIGDLMKLGSPYEICLYGIDHNRESDRNVLSTIRAYVELLKLDHFEFESGNLIVRYNIWYDL